MTITSGSSCTTCPGQQLVLECIISGSEIQLTRWRGSALQCSSDSGISLRYGEFITSGYANDTCNNGAILATMTSIAGSCYTTQLIVNTSLNLDGQSVECFSDDGSVESPVDAYTLRIKGPL